MKPENMVHNSCRPEARKPRAGIHLWSVYKGGRETSAELRPHANGFNGESIGCEAQILRDGELRSARLHPSQEAAIRWANEVRAWLLRDGWTVTSTK